MPELDKPPSPRRRRNPTKKQAKPANTNDIAELLSKKFAGINVFFVIMLIISFFVLSIGISIAKNVAEYRVNYSKLQDMKKEYQLLKVEHQKLLIEQQTFSSIPKVASKSVNELDMFYPTIQDKIILKTPPSHNISKFVKDEGVAPNAKGSSQ